MDQYGYGRQRREERLYRNMYMVVVVVAMMVSGYLVYLIEQSRHVLKLGAS